MEINEQKFKEMYLNDNIIISDILKEFNMKRIDLYRTRDKLNLPKIDRKTNKSKLVTKELLEQLYINEGKNLEEISVILNLSISFISKQLQKYNIQTRKITNQHQIKHFVNHEYFNNLNETSARILGLIASDGHLAYNKGSYMLRFTNKDLELCELLKNNIGGTFSLDSRNIYNNTIISKQIYDYLNTVGITERKTKTLNIDFSIFNTESLLYAFLIGILDGDGYIGYYQSKTDENLITNLKITIATGSEKFKEQIIDKYKEFHNCYCSANSIGSTGEISYNYAINCNIKINLMQLINKLIYVYPKCGMLNRKYQNLLRIKQHIERNHAIL